MTIEHDTMYPVDDLGNIIYIATYDEMDAYVRTINRRPYIHMRLSAHVIARCAYADRKIYAVECDVMRNDPIDSVLLAQGDDARGRIRIEIGASITW